MRVTVSPILSIGALVLLVLLAYKAISFYQAAPLTLVIVFPVLTIQLTIGRW